MDNANLRIVLIYCSFGWGYQGSQEELAALPGAVLPVPCAGRIEVEEILEAFRQGVDGVLILTCPPGDCHFRNGNSQLLNRVALLKNALGDFGIAPQHLAVRQGIDPEGSSMAAILEEFRSSLTGGG